MKYSLAIFAFDGMLADAFPFHALVTDVLAVRRCFQRIHPTVRIARQTMQQVDLPAWCQEAATSARSRPIKNRILAKWIT